MFGSDLSVACGLRIQTGESNETNIRGGGE